MRKLLLLLFPLLMFACEQQKTEDPAPTPDPTVVKTVALNVKSLPALIYNEEKITLEAEVNTDVTKVEFFFNNVSVGSVVNRPYKLEYTPEGFITGEYLVTAIASVDGKDYTGSTKTNLELRLGDKLQGGKVFSLTADKKHGLIASETDMEQVPFPRFEWGPIGNIGAIDKDNGQANTQKICASPLTHEGYKIWDFLKKKTMYNGYTDWYVPAYNELALLKQNKDFVGGFATKSNEAGYWSSTEIDKDRGYAINFLVLMGGQVDKAYSYRVRLIRKF